MATPSVTPKPEGFLESLLNAASPAGASGRPSDIYEGPKQLLTHPLDSIKLLAGAMNDTSNSELQQSAKAYGAGDPIRGFVHGVGYAVPFLGPLTAKAGEQANAHNFGGAAGTTLGTVAPILAGEMAKPTPLAGEHPIVANSALQEHLSTGGSTVDPRTGQSLAGTRHYTVGVSPETAQAHPTAPTPEQYSQFVAEHRDVLARNPNTAIGTSYDPTTGLHKIELVGTTTSKPAAQALAAHLGEDHAYHLGTDQKIPTGAAGDWQPSPMDVHARLKELAARTPQKETYAGTHYSDAAVDMIDGARRGSSGGAEAARLRLGTQTGMGEDAPGGFHTYKSGALPDTAMAGKKNVYQVRGRMAFASTDHPEFQQGYADGVQRASLAGADPQTAHQLGLNAAERAVQDAGFDGYFSPKHPNTRFHFGSEPAVPVAPKAAPEIDWAKPYGPQKADFRGKVPADSQGFDFSPPKDYGDAARADVEKRMGGPLPRGQAERRSATTAVQWPEEYRNGAQMLDSKGGAGANYTAGQLAAFKAKHGIGDVFYHGANAAGTQAIEGSGRIAPGAFEQAHLTPERTTAAAYARANGGKTFSVNAADLPPEILQHFKQTGRGPIVLQQGHDVPIANGSGESAASMEAINRAASEKNRGIQRVAIDSRSGAEKPLIGVDAVDYQPQPHEIVVQRTPQGDVELARGHAAGRY